MINCQITVNLDKTREIPQEINQAVQVAITKACFDTEAYAKAMAPVDAGNLVNSVTTDLSKLGILEGEVGTDVEYAVYVEFGTVNTPAQPYMVPAAELVGSEFAEVIAALIDSRID